MYRERERESGVGGGGREREREMSAIPGKQRQRHQSQPCNRSTDFVKVGGMLSARAQLLLINFTSQRQRNMKNATHSNVEIDPCLA